MLSTHHLCTSIIVEYSQERVNLQSEFLLCTEIPIQQIHICSTVLSIGKALKDSVREVHEKKIISANGPLVQGALLAPPNIGQPIRVSR